MLASGEHRNVIRGPLRNRRIAAGPRAPPGRAGAATISAWHTVAVRLSAESSERKGGRLIKKEQA